MAAMWGRMHALVQSRDASALEALLARMAEALQRRP